VNFAFIEALAALAGLVWTTHQLRRAPWHHGLWLVTACLGAAEAVYVLGLDSVAAVINATVGAGAAKVPENLAVMVFHFMVIWFFLDAAGAPVSRIQRQAALCAVACVLLVAARFAIPGPDRGIRYSLTIPSVPVAVFYLIPSLYIAYALTVEFRAAWRYARLSEPPLRHGLWIITAALAGKFVGGPAYRGTAIMANWFGYPASPGTFPIFHAILVFGIVTFPMGILYAGLMGRLSAARRWWQHRMAYHGLEPLWQLLHQAFPQDVLHRVPAGRWRHLTTFHSMHRRYYRRVIECRDGLVRISPYLHSAKPAGTEPLTPAVWATHLQVALRARANQLPPMGQPMVLASPRGGDLDADVAELLALSRAVNQTTNRSSALFGGRRSGKWR
jgi:hypothetical protein